MKIKKRFIFTISLLLIYCFSYAQSITISFKPKETNQPIDSIYATNLRTNEKVKLNINDSLTLVKYYTAIDDISDNFGFDNVYPNPTDQGSTLSIITEQNQNIEVAIYNNIGQLVANKNQFLEKGRHLFALEFPSPGIYHVSVNKNNKLSSIKTVYFGRITNIASIFHLGEDFPGSTKNEVISLKSATIQVELAFTKGDIILFECFSAKNTTLITHKPIESKTIEVEFVPCTDSDNRNYKVVKIGSQWWMAENLAYLPAVSPPSLGSDTAKYYYVYDYSGTDVAMAKNTLNYNTYGVLYNWPAAKASSPKGWHLPSDEEWKQLEMYLGMSQQQADTTGWRGTDQGKQLKSSTGWTTGNGTNLSGFSALPAGYRYSNGNFMHIGGDGCWWTSTDYGTNEPWFHFVSRGYNKIHRNHNYNFRKYAWSVRCIKDE